MRMRTSVLLSLAMVASATAQQTAQSTDVRIIRVWDCSINYVSKGWAINDEDCVPSRRSGKTAREVLDKRIATSWELRGYKVVDVEIYTERRDGKIRKKIWTVYDFQIRKIAK